MVHKLTIAPKSPVAYQCHHRLWPIIAASVFGIMWLLFSKS